MRSSLSMRSLAVVVSSSLLGRLLQPVDHVDESRLVALVVELVHFLLQLLYIINCNRLRPDRPNIRYKYQNEEYNLIHHPISHTTISATIFVNLFQRNLGVLHG